MQAERLQSLQKELQAVRERQEQLLEQQQEELLKNKSDQTTVEQLNQAILLRTAAERNLLDEWALLEAQRAGEQWGTALLRGGRQPTLCRAHSASSSHGAHWYLAHQVVAGAAVVHLLDLAASAEVGALHMMGHPLAQTVYINVECCASCLVEAPRYCSQVTALSSDACAAPWRRWQVLEQAGPVCTAPYLVNHKRGCSRVTESQHCGNMSVTSKHLCVASSAQKLDHDANAACRRLVAPAACS